VVLAGAVDYQFLGGHRADHSTGRTDVPSRTLSPSSEGRRRPVRCLRCETLVSKSVVLLLLVCALALPSAALGASTSGVKGSGLLQPGCPTDPLAADVYCPAFPVYFWFKADRGRTGTLTGRYRTRWMVPGRTSTTFSGRVLC